MHSCTISPAFDAGKRRSCATLSLGICEQKSLQSNREIITTKSMDATIGQLGAIMSFIGFTYSNMGGGFLTGAKIT